MANDDNDNSDDNDDGDSDNSDSNSNGDSDSNSDGDGDSDGNNSNNLMKELQTNIEALHLLNKINIREYINYPEERNIKKLLINQKLLNLIIY